jgi:hypothetical protein
MKEHKSEKKSEIETKVIVGDIPRWMIEIRLVRQNGTT